MVEGGVVTVPWFDQTIPMYGLMFVLDVAGTPASEGEFAPYQIPIRYSAPPVRVETSMLEKATGVRYPAAGKAVLAVYATLVWFPPNTTLYNASMKFPEEVCVIRVVIVDEVVIPMSSEGVKMTPLNDQLLEEAPKSCTLAVQAASGKVSTDLGTGAAHLVPL